MGNAEPAQSPASSDPDGDVVDFDAISDVESAGDVVAVRTADALIIGTPDQLKAGSGEQVAVDAACGDLTATADGFVLGCGDKVLIYPADNPSAPETVAVTEDFPVTAATQLSSGEIFVASNDAAEVSVYKDGKRIDTMKVQAPTDQIEAVRNEGGTDNVVRVWRMDTTIQNLDWTNNREGGRLRVGQGLGQISDATDGVIVTSDTGGKRIAIYTADDVVRLHQYGNLDGIPWAVAWDTSRSLAWITTTDNNQAHAFDIASGVPVEKTEDKPVSTVADAQHMTVTDSGTVVLGSATGDGLQIITDPAL